MAIFNSYVKLPEGTIDSILVIIQYSFFMNTYERNSEVHWSNFLLLFIISPHDANLFFVGFLGEFLLLVILLEF